MNITVDTTFLTSELLMSELNPCSIAFIQSVTSHASPQISNPAHPSRHRRQYRLQYLAPSLAGRFPGRLVDLTPDQGNRSDYQSGLLVKLMTISTVNGHVKANTYCQRMENEAKWTDDLIGGWTV
jgi:hypothetical protein